jgi:hypothetical protein
MMKFMMKNRKGRGRGFAMLGWAEASASDRIMLRSVGASMSEALVIGQPPSNPSS